MADRKVCSCSISCQSAVVFFSSLVFNKGICTFPGIRLRVRQRNILNVKCQDFKDVCQRDYQRIQCVWKSVTPWNVRKIKAKLDLAHSVAEMVAQITINCKWVLKYSYLKAEVGPILPRPAFKLLLAHTWTSYLFIVTVADLSGLKSAYECVSYTRILTLLSKK